MQSKFVIARFGASRLGHARALAGIVSVGVLLPLAACGGEDSVPTASAVRAAERPPAERDGAAAQSADAGTAHTPPVDQLIVRLKPAAQVTTPGTAAHAMRAANAAARIDGVIERASAQWDAVAALVTANDGNGSTRVHAAKAAQPSSPFAPQPVAQVLRPTGEDALVLQLQKSLSAADATRLAQMFAADPEVAYAEPDLRMQLFREPDDTNYGLQWNLSDGKVGANVQPAWDVTQGSPSIVVAVVDTGYLPHPDLQANLVPGYNFVSDARFSNGRGRGPDATDPGDWVTGAELNDPNSPFYDCLDKSVSSSWHGTKVAGILSAVTNNDIGIAGVGWKTKIQPVRTMGKCGGTLSDITDGMRWAAGLPVQGVPANQTPAKIINLSLGASGACSISYQAAVDAVLARGVAVIAATGNASKAELTQPANCRGVISVGATNKSGQRTNISNYGPGTTLSAPGEQILTLSNTGKTTPDLDTYELVFGTSFAAPHVSGTAALMLAVNGKLTPAGIGQVLQSTVHQPPNSATWGPAVKPPGAGILDAAAAIVNVWNNR